MEIAAMTAALALDLKSNAGKLYQVLKDGTAPVQIAKPIFAKDLEYAKMTGAKTMADLFGHPERADNQPLGKCLTSPTAATSACCQRTRATACSNSSR
jgi:hypothetical protein